MMGFVTIEELNQKRLEFLQKKAHMEAAIEARIKAYKIKQNAIQEFEVANKKEDECRTECDKLDTEVRKLSYRYMSEQRPEESIQMTMPVVNVADVSDDDIPFAGLRQCDCQHCRMMELSHAVKL
jgi:hypothetical protein